MPLPLPTPPLWKQAISIPRIARALTSADAAGKLTPQRKAQFRGKFRKWVGGAQSRSMKAIRGGNDLHVPSLPSDNFEQTPTGILRDSTPAGNHAARRLFHGPNIGKIVITDLEPQGFYSPHDGTVVSQPSVKTVMHELGHAATTPRMQAKATRLAQAKTPIPKPRLDPSLERAADRAALKALQEKPEQVRGLLGRTVSPEDYKAWREPLTSSYYLDSVIQASPLVPASHRFRPAELSMPARKIHTLGGDYDVARTIDASPKLRDAVTRWRKWLASRQTAMRSQAATSPTAAMGLAAFDKATAEHARLSARGANIFDRLATQQMLKTTSGTTS